MKFFKLFKQLFIPREASFWSPFSAFCRMVNRRITISGVKHATLWGRKREKKKALIKSQKHTDAMLNDCAEERATTAHTILTNMRVVGTWSLSTRWNLYNHISSGWISRIKGGSSSVILTEIKIKKDYKILCTQTNDLGYIS